MLIFIDAYALPSVIYTTPSDIYVNGIRLITGYKLYPILILASILTFMSVLVGQLGFPTINNKPLYKVHRLQYVSYNM